MRSIHQVVLSIGSNIGNRQRNLQQCVQLIREQIDGIQKISGIYETPAWGFDSDPFYNAAVLLETNLSPQKLLSELQKIEHQLGKIKHANQQVYHARIIDIDIVTYNQEITDTPDLQIPHPHFHNRKFVLQPMMEFNLDWTHPVLNKTFTDLVNDCLDTSDCKKVFEFI